MLMYIVIRNKHVIKIQTFSFKEMHLKMLSPNCVPFCLGLNIHVFTVTISCEIHPVCPYLLYGRMVYMSILTWLKTNSYCLFTLKKTFVCTVISTAQFCFICKLFVKNRMWYICGCWVAIDYGLIAKSICLGHTVWCHQVAWCMDFAIETQINWHSPMYSCSVLECIIIAQNSLFTRYNCSEVEIIVIIYIFVVKLTFEMLTVCRQ